MGENLYGFHPDCFHDSGDHFNRHFTPTIRENSADSLFFTWFSDRHASFQENFNDNGSSLIRILHRLCKKINSTHKNPVDYLHVAQAQVKVSKVAFNSFNDND